MKTDQLIHLDGEPLILLRLSVAQVHAVESLAYAARQTISQVVGNLIENANVETLRGHILDDDEEDPGQVGPL